jgi:hypothetical protein
VVEGDQEEREAVAGAQGETQEWARETEITEVVMATATLQVTIVTNPTRVSATSVPCRQLFFQNNQGHNMRVGDANTTVNRGALMASGTPGGSVNLGAFTASNTDLQDWYVAGTPGDVLDVIYVT